MHKLDIQKRSSWAIAGIFLALLASYALLRVLAEPAMEHPYFGKDDFLVIAHRGGLGAGPENTLFLFRRALDQGADVLDMDLRSTADGELVLLHDKTVDRTTNGRGQVRDLTLPELKQLDAAHDWSPDNGNSFPLRGKGIRIPTLAEVFDAFPEVRLNLELKEHQPNVAESLCKLILEYKRPDQVMIASSKAESMKSFRSVCPNVATSATASEAFAFYWLQRFHMASLYSPSAQTLQIPPYYKDKPLITARSVVAAHSRNMRIYVWTVNDVEQLQRLIELGVDGIITDYPARLTTLLGRNR
jgi:glycerophosphoryl diester phosphodiesterase